MPKFPRYNEQMVDALVLWAVIQAQAAEVRSFERVMLVETKGETSASVSIGDIDADGDLDLILA